MLKSKQIEELKKTIKEYKQITMKQNKEIVMLGEELRHAKSLIGLYESCLMRGIKIDFPNSSVKGGNADNTGDFDFSRF